MLQRSNSSEADKAAAGGDAENEGTSGLTGRASTASISVDPADAAALEAERKKCAPKA